LTNCAQFVKEGKGAIKCTRLSCRSFAANAVRLQLRALAYNLGNFMRTLAMPQQTEPWSLKPAREADQHRHQGRQPWAVRYVSDGRGRGAAADVPGNPVADRPASGAACPGMRSAGGQMRQTTTSEVRLESRPKARGCRQLDFIIYLEDMKRLQIIHLEDMRGVTDAVTCGLNTRKPVH
jgi:hypothetical protein